MSSHLTLEGQESLQRHLTRIGSYGRAEGESSETFARTFLPVSEHVRAFEPDVVLIIGERGAGKSELFRAVLQEKLLPAIARHIHTVRFPSLAPEHTRWLTGYPLGAGEFPDGRSLKRFAQAHRGDREALPDLWLAYLVRRLRGEFDKETEARLKPLLSQEGGSAEDNYRAFSEAGDEPVLALDRLDRELREQDRWLFVGYDELDTLGRSDWYAMGAATRGLISLWANYTRRWRRLRAKIFLRTDLFQRHTALAGADLAKLAANRVELSWSERNLYAMLVKRIANYNSELLAYCQRARIPFQPKDPALWFIPKLLKAEDARPLVHRLIGEFMGEGPRKGRTFNWLIDHISDAHGKALPRPLVRLIERAAEIEIKDRQAAVPKLLAHTSVRRALDDVSKEHVQQMAAHECPWLVGVRRRLSGLEVPCTLKEFERRLERNWEQSWSEDEGVPAPVESARDLMDYLEELGVIRYRSNGLVDVPDLFLAGLELKRRGGVARS